METTTASNVMMNNAHIALKIAGANNNNIQALMKSKIEYMKQITKTKNNNLNILISPLYI